MKALRPLACCCFAHHLDFNAYCELSQLVDTHWTRQFNKKMRDILPWKFQNVSANDGWNGMLLIQKVFELVHLNGGLDVYK